MVSVIPNQFIAVIRSQIPWYVPNRYSLAKKIFERLVDTQHVVARRCTAYACNDGWSEGLGAGFECVSCGGSGWVGE
ncbi:hypothetical protein AU106_gp262 [Sinorhizobium phage phiM9]|uniref:Uncharacterized protein n=1 Tax=Sinorhizobium phage phiM9 TaxID=1636182 RepID=A0A0F6R7T1_9CAUD|nr:hypothetical protein AU106_gp262 [Sinorhizobium phage phiM9]AKE44893.1 hypothetical protein Sm_phiM9_266 [Sinorhizobium phage phiM9]